MSQLKAPSMSSRPYILRRGDGILAAEIGNACVAIWRRDSTIPRFQIQRDALADVVARLPGKAGFFCVVEETSGVPNDEVRTASSQMFDKHGANLRAIAMIIEGGGFRSAIVRSVAAGIVMLMGKRVTPISYFANVEAGAQWIGRYVDIGAVSNFKQQVEDVRMLFDK